MTRDDWNIGRPGLISRRRLLSTLSFGAAAAFTVPGLFAEQLQETAATTEGPFYPDRLPLDTDNDLLIINDSITPAVGRVTHLSGRILDRRGDPIRDALVEIWQADSNGLYIHSQHGRPEQKDPHFQGFGRFLTGSSGEYRFRTIKPVFYASRAPHVHYRVDLKNGERFTTQVHVEGDPKNETDSVLRRISDPALRQSIIVPFVPLPGSQAGELAARFDIVLGVTAGL